MYQIDQELNGVGYPRPHWKIRGLYFMSNYNYTTAFPCNFNFLSVSDTDDNEDNVANEQDGES